MAGMALALGGGGAKGIFQVGAWQAFRELGIEFDAVAGTSIGAVNAGLMCGASFDDAIEMWENLKMEQCLAFSQIQSLKSDDLLSLRNLNLLARELLHEKKLSTRPLRELLERYISETAVRESPLQCGVMTTLTPSLRGYPVWIQDMAEGRLIDYIMASARLPGLDPVEIDGQQFLDGGLAEHVPVSMLRSRGWRRIVAIDLNEKPTSAREVDDNTQLIYIHDPEDLGGFLDITPGILQRNLRLGYLDTLKAFDRLKGDRFAFWPDDYARLLRDFGYETVAGLEQAGAIYELDRLVIYDHVNFIEAIRQKRADYQMLYQQKRAALRIEHKLQAIRRGELKMLHLMPPLRLAFLMEILIEGKQQQEKPRLPPRLFSSIRSAADALMLLPDELRNL